MKVSNHLSGRIVATAVANPVVGSLDLLNCFKSDLVLGFEIGFLNKAPSALDDFF